MANINKFIPFILKWEGGYVNDPNDLGGPTNQGVTLKTWQDCGYDKNGDGIIDEEDLKQIFVLDVIECVLRPHYWNRWQADRIQNQSIANLLVDWLWTSGTTAIKTSQHILNLRPDGIVGEKTLAAINDYPNQHELFERFKAERAAYIERICQNRPANRRFKKGWLARLSDIKFAYSVLIGLLLTCFMGCKSAASNESVLAETKTELYSGKESEQQIRSRQKKAFTKQSGLAENTEALIETFTVRFDTSVSGQPLVREMSKTIASLGKTRQHSASLDMADDRTDSMAILRNETIGMKNTENVQIRKVSESRSHLRLYGSIALIFVLAALGWVFKKKIINFFWHSIKK